MFLLSNQFWNRIRRRINLSNTGYLISLYHCDELQGKTDHNKVIKGSVITTSYQKAILYGFTVNCSVL